MNARKISFANIQGRMSRNEMRSIMAGDGYQPLASRGCDAQACGGGGSGTCRNVIEEGKKPGCKCSSQGGVCPGA